MNDHDRLIRIDERTERTASDVLHMKKTLKKEYVTKKEFNPVKKIAYGAVAGLGAIVIGVIGVLKAR